VRPRLFGRDGQGLLLVEYEDLCEFFPGTIDPLDGHGHRVAVMCEYSAAAGSVMVCGVHAVVSDCVCVDLLYRNDGKRRVAFDRDGRTIAF